MQEQAMLLKLQQNKLKYFGKVLKVLNALNKQSGNSAQWVYEQLKMGDKPQMGDKYGGGRMNLNDIWEFIAC